MSTNQSPTDEFPPQRLATIRAHLEQQKRLQSEATIDQLDFSMCDDPIRQLEQLGFQHAQIDTFSRHEVKLFVKHPSGNTFITITGAVSSPFWPDFNDHVSWPVQIAVSGIRHPQKRESYSLEAGQLRFDIQHHPKMDEILIGSRSHGFRVKQTLGPDEAERSVSPREILALQPGGWILSTDNASDRVEFYIQPWHRSRKST